MSFTETDLGFFKIQENHLIFFGKNSATLEQITQAYPDLTFQGVTQKHTDICVQSTVNSSDIIADAHFTQEKNIALIVKTADCQPILAYDSEQKMILAIHAGWRGVENQITSKALIQAGIKNANIFIGPCIQQTSFEVDPDVKEQLERICKIEKASELLLQTFIAKALDQGVKYYINLTEIVLAEIKAANITASVSLLPLDTMTDLKFHSYRRDKQNSGRNYSFIARI